MAAWIAAPIHNSLIRADALVGLLADEKVGNKVGRYEDTSGTTDQADVMDVVDLGIAEDVLNRARSTTNDILAEAAEFFETGTSEGSEFNALKERVNFGGCFGKRVRLARSHWQAVRETTNNMRV